MRIGEGMISDYDVIDESASENDRLGKAIEYQKKAIMLKEFASENTRLRKEIDDHKRTRMQLILSAFVVGYMTCYLIDRLVLV